MWLYLDFNSSSSLSDDTFH
uniref:Uncharacterized protein n=1 Tax=Arundo donax TaxID=35708 RepID=A0A0A9B488_ARUDO